MSGALRIGTLGGGIIGSSTGVIGGISVPGIGGVSLVGSGIFTGGPPGGKVLGCFTGGISIGTSGHFSDFISLLRFLPHIKAAIVPSLFERS